MYNPKEVKWPGVFSVATRILFGRVVTWVVGVWGATWSLREIVLLRGRERRTAFMKDPGEVTPHDHGGGWRSGSKFGRQVAVAIALKRHGEENCKTP